MWLDRPAEELDHDPPERRELVTPLVMNLATREL
jgi:hypothetical protein